METKTVKLRKKKIYKDKEIMFENLLYIFDTIQHHHSIYIQNVYNNHEDLNMKFTLPKQKLFLVPLVFKTLKKCKQNRNGKNERAPCKLNK